MHFSLPLILACSAYVAAFPGAIKRDIDPNNPSASDPKTPPKGVTAPPAAPNPYPSGFPVAPTECAGGGLPSNNCMSALEKKATDGDGGYIWFESDSQCSDSQKSFLETSLWDAISLANHAQKFPANGAHSSGEAAGIYWMGSNYNAFTNRIAGNFQRITNFKTTKTSSREYITVSCNDKQKVCGSRAQGQVGGYAWTYNGWTGYYHYITLCTPFFGVDRLSDKLGEVEKELDSGSNRMASDLNWLKTSGQYFLHEMMHTRIADGGVEPHITDTNTRSDPNNGNAWTPIKAYGPRNVHKLALNINKGGGASVATTNADSYAILASALWWWDITGYWPSDTGKTAAQTSGDNVDLLMVHVDLQNSVSTASGNPIQAALQAEAATYDDVNSNDPSDPTSSAAPVSSSPPSPTSSRAPAPASATPAPPPPAQDTCGDWYKFFFDEFDIYGKNFDPAKLGTNGDSLKSKLNHCGAVTDWSFTQLTNDPNGYQWHAHGRQPIGTKSCVGSAVADLGGQKDGCTGAG